MRRRFEGVDDRYIWSYRVSRWIDGAEHRWVTVRVVAEQEFTAYTMAHNLYWPADALRLMIDTIRGVDVREEIVRDCRYAGSSVDLGPIWGDAHALEGA